MKNPKLDPELVAKWLNHLSDHDFIAFFYANLAERHVYREERRHTDAHLVLCVARRDREDDGRVSAWQNQILCPTPETTWASDAPVCQFGRCATCDQAIASWSTRPNCGICGEQVSAT